MNNLKKAFLIAILFQIGATLSAQTPDPKTALLLGRWEVLSYSEQGVQVDKKQNARPQAVKVYDHISRQRAQVWYGYSDYEDLSRREAKAFERWSTLDSLIEVDRVTEAISMPYFAIFFPDSTLSMYNKDAANQIHFPEVRHFVFSPGSMSLDIVPGLAGSNGYGYGVKTDVQILFLSETSMRLFIPDEAEIVELVKTAYSIP